MKSGPRVWVSPYGPFPGTAALYTIGSRLWKTLLKTLIMNSIYCTLGIEEVEEPRPTYWGEKRISPITGQQEYYYPPWMRKVKTYCISYPIVILCMKLATVVVLLYFRFLHAVESQYANVGGIVATVMLILPSIFFAVMIAVSNNLYRKLATFLNEWGKCGHGSFLDFAQGGWIWPKTLLNLQVINM